MGNDKMTDDDRLEEEARAALIAAAEAMPERAACPYPMELIPRPLLDQLVSGDVAFSSVEATDIAATDEEMARARPIDPAKAARLQAARLPGQRGPQRAPTKERISIALDPDVLASLRASGRGWQSRVNEILRAQLGLDRK